MYAYTITYIQYIYVNLFSWIHNRLRFPLPSIESRCLASGFLPVGPPLSAWAVRERWTR